MKQDNLIALLGEDKISEGAAHKLLSQTLDHYLGTVETMAEFAKAHLADKWLISFGEILKSEEGTPAWRACQQLWQSSLLDSIAQLSQLTHQTQDEIVQVRQELGLVTNWLDKWGRQLTTQAGTERNSTGDKAFDSILAEHMQVLQEKLNDLKADTRLVIELLNQRFTQLDSEKVMINFLQKELLNDQYVNLRQAGYDADYDDMSLAKVFVDLPTSNERQVDPPEEKSYTEGLPAGIIADILTIAKEPLDPESQSLQADRQQDEQPGLPSKPRRGRFVIIGGPGQGKTTVGQFVCQLFRAAILDKRQDVYYEKVHHTLNEIKALCSQEGIELPSVPRFPFRIVLSDFAAQLASRQAVNSLISYIVERVRARTNQEVTADHLREWLARYPWAIILDGLDEVPASSNRDEVLSAIDSFWIDATGCNADVLVVATTRPQGYNDEFAPSIYQHKWLVPLSKARAKHYAYRLVTMRYKQDQDRQKKVLERLYAALDDEATARLMRSPLQVTIMAALVDRIGKPPQERWSLFQKYYNVIYQRETERDIPAATILRNYEPDINAIHYRVGLLLQIESEYSGRTGVRLSLDRFASLVESRLEEEGHEGQEMADLKKQIIEAAIDRLVFLVGVEENKIGFEIRSLQEFMAAEALMGASDDLLQKRLRQIAPVSNWRSVFLFAAGKCFALEDRQHLRETVRGICVELNESEKSEDEVFKVTLAGSQLALDLLEDGPAQRQPKYAKSLARLACRLWDLPPNKYHIHLADLYQEKLEDVYSQEMENRLQSTACARLGAWNSLIHLAEKRAAWFETSVNVHWPSDERELIDLLQVAVGSGKLTWIISRLCDLLTRLSPSDLMQKLSEINFDLATVQEPKWLCSFLRPAKAAGIAFQLSAIHRIDAAFEIRIISDGASDWVKVLKDLPNPNPDWLPFVGAARFLENPERHILAQELRNVAQHSSIESMRWAAKRLPWMMGALLDGIESKQELEELAERVDRGELGDTKTWHAAEQRWLAQGIVVGDLDYMTDEHWPFDKNIGQIGIPLMCFEVQMWVLQLSHAPSPEHLYIDEFLALYVRHGQSKLRSRIAAWIIWSITLFQFLKRQNLAPIKWSGISELISFNQFQAVVQDSDKDKRILADALAVPEWEKANGEEYIDFVDYLGKERKCFVFPHMFMVSAEDSERVVKLLTEAFVKQPTRIGVFKLLSLFAIEGYRPSLPQHLLRLEQYDTTDLRQAAIIIRLAQQDWDQTEAKALAKHAIELAKDQPEIIGHILSTINANRTSGLSGEAFLVELLRNIPITDWSTRKEVLDALDNSLRRRTSRLTDMWTELGLPESLKGLVHTSDATPQ